MIKIKSIYIKKKKFPKLKIEFDKTNKIRPSWIYIKNPLKGMKFIAVRYKKRSLSYFAYLPSNLFLPVIHTKEDLKKYYGRFSEYYDEEIKKSGQNIRATKFLMDKLSRYLSKEISILDVGAGTGLAEEIFIKKGFTNITLLDHSPKMLNKAKKKSLLKNCNFILTDFLKFKTKKKFDLIISIFSLGIINYFGEKKNKVFNKARGLLKSRGIIAFLGHELEPEKDFKTIKKGKFKLTDRTIVNYYIGRKK